MTAGCEVGLDQLALRVGYVAHDQLWDEDEQYSFDDMYVDMFPSFDEFVFDLPKSLSPERRAFLYEISANASTIPRRFSGD